MVQVCKVSVHVFVRLEKCAETESSVAAQSFIPGEVVDRDWFYK